MGFDTALRTSINSESIAKASPLFRMFEVDAFLPMDKDLFVEVFDWDLIGTDDKIGYTVIDLENRYYSSFRAWCGLPESYYT